MYIYVCMCMHGPSAPSAAPKSEWVMHVWMSHVWMSHVVQIDASWNTTGWVMSHTWMSERMTRLYMWVIKWLIYAYAPTQPYLHHQQPPARCMRVCAHSCVWHITYMSHKSFICVTWHIHMCHTCPYINASVVRQRSIVPQRSSWCHRVRWRVLAHELAQFCDDPRLILRPLVDVDWITFDSIRLH